MVGLRDNEEFARSLGDWVDLGSLARYAATQNLLVNADNMAGPGQNYYLGYDLEAKKLSVLSWDLNLAMMIGIRHWTARQTGAEAAARLQAAHRHGTARRDAARR